MTAVPKGGEDSLAKGERFKIEIFRDMLFAIHETIKVGKPPAPSSIADRAMMSDRRLKERMAELVMSGFVEGELSSGTVSITRRGYEYLMDFQKHIDPILRKYGLGRYQGGDSP